MSDHEITVGELVKRVLAPVAGRACDGDRDAAIQLLSVGSTLCDAIETFRQAQPDLARSLARRIDAWPVLGARHLAAVRNLAQVLEELQLSEAHPLRHILVPRPGPGNRPDLDNPYSSLVLDIRDHLARLRRMQKRNDPQAADWPSVPALSAETFDQWWGIGWEWFMIAHDQNLFADSRLGPLQHEEDAIAAANNEGITIEAYVAGKVKQKARTLLIPK